MNSRFDAAAFAALVLGLHVGAISLTAFVVTSTADASARISCRREAALALIVDTHCATRKAGATSTAWGY